MDSGLKYGRLESSVRTLANTVDVLVQLISSHSCVYTMFVVKDLLNQKEGNPIVNQLAMMTAMYCGA